MPVSLDVWSVLALLTRTLLYAAVVTALGSLLVRSLGGRVPRDRARILPFDGLLAGAIATGLLASVVYFLLRVGAVSQQGLAGMNDWAMASIMAETALGDGTALRLAGFLLLTASLPLTARTALSHVARRVLWSVVAAGLLLLAASYAALGHVRELGWTGRLAVVMHILAIALWTGSLWPLWNQTRSLPRDGLIVLMRRFGDLARWMLAVMLVSGVVLAWQLTGSLAALTGTGYGRLLLIKLLLVVLLAGIGARHRYQLVPALRRSAPPGRLSATARLQRSLLLEIMVAVSVLVTTVTLTGLFSPPR